MSAPLFVFSRQSLNFHSSEKTDFSYFLKSCAIFSKREDVSAAREEINNEIGYEEIFGTLLIRS